ncbi:MAG: HAMP domain-containing histidine kinase [Oscillospiraceae bacterium]|nr:HAMP domain-containing histidine kinase [Oscillospiraceae bacterium]
MKRCLDKVWAKMLAYFLTLLCLAAALACAAGAALLTDTNAWADGGERLRQSYYTRLCSGSLERAAWYLADTADSEDAEAWFARSFAADNCVLVVTNDQGQVVARTAEYDGAVLLTVTAALTDYGPEDFAGWHITASLKEDFRPDSPETMVMLYLADHRAAPVTAGLAAVGLALCCLVFSLASAGHWQGYEGIHLTWFDKLPVDGAVAAMLLPVVMLLDAPFDEAVVLLTVAVAWGLLTLIAFAAQCKAGEVTRRAIIGYGLRGLWQLLRWLGYVVRHLPLVAKTAAGVAAVLVFDFVCVSFGHDGAFLLLLLVVHAVLGLGLIYLAIGLRKLQKGGQALAEGQYDHTVDTQRLWGDFRRHGENLNAVQQGVRKAVAEQMKSERLKTELITNVSHDIKTPLTSIVNYVDLLKKENVENAAAREYIDVLDRQSQRLRRLTEDLVEAAKAATGNVAVSWEATDVNVFLHQVMGEYEQRLRQAGLEPVLTTDEAAPRIMADGRLLWRVMDNLLGNVCKYALPGTRVYVSASLQGYKVRLTVKNISRTPLNVSADELTERFVRGDASRSTEGSGLGLNIAASLVKLQKGEFNMTVDGDLFKAQMVFDRI